LGLKAIGELSLLLENRGELLQFPTQKLAMIDNEIRTADDDFYVRAVDLAKVLKITDNEISRLVRSGVMTRVPDGRSFLYPFLANVTAYTEFHRSKKEALHQEFLRAKAGREKAQRQAIETTNRVRGGELVDRQELINRLTSVVAAFREQLLARADRVVGELGRTKNRKAKVAKFREADLAALGVLSDLFKVAGGNEASA
jgi:hypothetical protein